MCDAMGDGIDSAQGRVRGSRKGWPKKPKQLSVPSLNTLG
jgi:hypothetical protein